MKTFFCFLLLLCFYIPSVQAQLSVSKTTLELAESNPRSSVRVSNTGADTLYVNLEIEQLLDPAGDESLRKTIDLLSNPDILVLPQQMVLSPGQTKIVRVVTTKKDVTSDKVYRLKVVPFAGKPLLGEKQLKSADVKILMGFKLLVLVRPEDMLPKLEYQLNGQSISFSNTGNTSVLLREIEVCDAVKDVCHDLGTNRVYPGEIHSVALPAELPLDALRVKTRQSVKNKENTVLY